MDISIVIPNYNGEELLKKNLPKVTESVRDYKDNVEVIIVDDCSSDNSIDEIKNQKSKIKNTNQKLKIITNEKNLGFSSTANRGVKESKGDLVLLLNTDVVPKKGFLDSLVRHFDDPKVFAVGCMDKSVESGKIVLRGRGVGRWEKGFLVHSRGEVDKTSTLWVSGGSGAFRKSIWEKLGGFDELYNPFYWEDIDLSYRALKSGYKILFEPKSIVMHEHEKGAIKSKYNISQVKRIAYRNQFIFVWKNVTDINLQFSHVFWLLYYFIKAFINRDWVFFAGFTKAFMLFPKIIKSILRAQKLFVKSDKEIIDKFYNQKILNV